jgi:hypothetical protein
VGGLAKIGAVLQQLVQRSLVKEPAGLRQHAVLPQDRHQLGSRADTGKILKDPPDDGGLRLVHHQLAVADVIAKRQRSPHPHAAGFGGGDLVAHPLADHLTLELRKGEQNVERQPAHAGRGVKRLGPH